MSEFDYKAELDAVQNVLRILSEFDDVVRDKILRTVSAFFATGQPVGDAMITLPSATQSFFEKRPSSPKQFLLEKQPQTAIERVTCLAYFLTHYRETPQFNTNDIVKLNFEAAQPKLTNASYSINNAVKAHLLVGAGGGKRQISAAGELYIEALPDRTAAKTAMGGVMRRPSRRRATRKRPAK